MSGTMRVCQSILPFACCALLLGCAKRVSVPASEADGAATIGKSQFVNLLPQDRGARTRRLAVARLSSEMILPGDQLELGIYEKLPVSQDKRIEMKRVDEDGFIFLIPVGKIEVAGLSPGQLQKVVEEKLSPLVVTPYCEVAITKRAYEPLVYVFGEANKTGTVPLKPGDHLLDVLAAVGGCNANAYRRSIKIIRVNDTNVSMLSVNVYDILGKGRMQENLLMQDQDVVFVPRRFLTNLQEVASIVGTLLPWYYYVKNFQL